MDAPVLTCSFLVGMVVLRGMSVVMTPPAVSMPSDSGATSSSSRSCTFALVSPPRMAACAQVQPSQACIARALGALLGPALSLAMTLVSSHQYSL